MPRPRQHDDQPGCDECSDWAEWHDPSQSYLCEGCEAEWNEAHQDETEESQDAAA